MFLTQVFVVASLVSTNLAALPCFQCEDFAECGFAVESDVEQRLSDLQEQIRVLQSEIVPTTLPAIVEAVLSIAENTDSHGSDFPVEAVVDGNTGTDIDISGTCFASVSSDEPFIKLSMEQEMSVSLVKVLMKENGKPERNVKLR